MPKIEIIKADITKLNVDAIVNAANNSLMGGGGVDWAIHKAAGPELMEECRTLKGCATGQSKITKGYNLPAKFIIHSVGPVWNNGTNNEIELLKSCYFTSMQLASKNNIKTIAFPSISTGAYRFPFDKACKIAWQTVSEFLRQDKIVETVYLVFYGDRDFENARRLFEDN